MKTTLHKSLPGIISAILIHIASATTSALHAQELEPKDTTFIINEIMVANNDMFLDNSNNYGAWIELYNPSSTDISLRNLLVSDGTNQFKMLSVFGSVPAKGYKTLWFDHYYTEGTYGTGARQQVNFKLNYEGGDISILDAQGQVLATASYPQAIPRCSYARKSPDSDTWGTTSTPTPGASNEGSTFSTKRIPPPTVDTDSRIFAGGSFTVKVRIPYGTELRYTTDGSIPSATNGETSKNGVFEISRTTILRLCLTMKGSLPSAVVTRSYILRNHDYYLPVISIATAPANLYDNKIGIYTKGTNGTTGNGQSSACNWNMDWERPVNMEYLTPQKDANGEITYTSQINQEVNMEICGGWTRAYGAGYTDGKYWQMKSSFRLKTDKQYEGVNELAYPVFPSKPFNKYKCWQVRNGGNDTSHRIIDTALQQIVIKSGFYVDCQDYQPAHVFFNGEYLGMLNIRESNNRHYGYSNYGIDTDDMDQFDLSNSQYNQKVGDNKAWTNLVKLASQLSTKKTPELYEEICQQLDIDEYVNYMALECFLGSSDWITNTNNVKGFRSRSDGKFHFVLFDLDSAFGSTSMLSSVINTSGGGNVDDLFRSLMRYDPFRRQFVDAFCLVAGSVFEPDRCETIIQEIYNNTNYALSFEGNSSSTSLISKIKSSHSSTCVANMRNYMALGSGMYFNISSNIPQARLLLNGHEIPTGKFNGQLYSYKNEPVELTAKAPAGFRFAGWVRSDIAQQTSQIIPSGEEWAYYDQGSMDGKKWKEIDFDEQANGWKTGKAPLGYARDGYFMQTNSATILDYGPDSNHKRPTYYFRKTFNLPAAPSEDEILTFNYSVDDGMMLYVNGQEVEGYFVTSGSPYSSYTTGGHYESEQPYNGSIAIPKELLQAGQNIIAVEVKNTSATSTDIYFDASLSITGSNTTLLSADETVNLAEHFAVNDRSKLVAKFEPITAEVKRWEAGATPIRINEVSAANDIYINDLGKKADWVELYNTTDNDIPLQGLYLSDNSRKPQKFQMQDGVIPAHGTCIVWCDGKESNGQLHAPFKLDNADGATISIQAEDGRWADRMTYLEQGRWQTYGRYPDGGNMETILNQPSIDKSNKIGMLDFCAVDSDAWMGRDITITLDLAEGWNWTSHNLAEEVDRSRFTSYARKIQSQSDEFSVEEAKSGVSTLLPTHGYKTQMNQDVSITLRGNLFSPDSLITLHEGWNWTGFPLYNATALTSALANYEACDGDKIVGLDAFATFEEGQWHGSLSSLQPGQAYMFYTSQEQSFRWQSLSPMRARVRRYAAAQQTEDGAWEAGIHAYPDVMTVTATVYTEGDMDMDGLYYVGAFDDKDECRGVGVLDGETLYMNIHGYAREKLTFRLLDAQGECYTCPESITFQPLGNLGSHANPYLIGFCSQDVIDEIAVLPVKEKAVRSVSYFNLSGQRIARPSDGIYIRKTVFEDGSTKSILVK